MLPSHDSTVTFTIRSLIFHEHLFVGLNTIFSGVHPIVGLHDTVAGQQAQGFLRKVGLTGSYLCLNAFAYALIPS